MRTNALPAAWIAALMLTVDVASADQTSFVRHALPEGSPLPTLTSEPWRFGFERSLHVDGADLVVVHGDGTFVRHVPERSLPGGTWRWVADDGSGSSVEGGGGRHVYRDARDASVIFERGRPVEAMREGTRIVRWRYADERLVAVTDARGDTLNLSRDATGRVTRIEFPDGALWQSGGASADLAAPLPATDPAQCPVDDTCDAGASPPGDAFAAGPHVRGATTRDLRPGSCRSYFVDYYGTSRGTRIEGAFEADLGTDARVPTAEDFPVVDFVSSTELVTVRSRDLSSPTYTNPSRPALFDQLLRDGRDVERLLLEPLRERGHVVVTARPEEIGTVTRIDAHPPRRPVLELVVRHGKATPDQIDQIQRARTELATRHGIELRVIEIP